MYKAVTKKQDGLNTNLEVFGVLPFAIGGFRSRRGAVACGETLRSLTWRTRSLPDGSFEHVCRMRTSCVSANHLHSCTHPQGLAFSRITQSSPHPPRGRTSEPPFWSGVLFPLRSAVLNSDRGPTGVACFISIAIVILVACSQCLMVFIVSVGLCKWSASV